MAPLAVLCSSATAPPSSSVGIAARMRATPRMCGRVPCDEVPNRLKVSNGLRRPEDLHGSPAHCLALSRLRRESCLDLIMRD